MTYTHLKCHPPFLGLPECKCYGSLLSPAGHRQEQACMSMLGFMSGVLPNIHSVKPFVVNGALLAVSALSRCWATSQELECNAGSTYAPACVLAWQQHPKVQRCVCLHTIATLTTEVKDGCKYCLAATDASTTYLTSPITCKL